MTALFSSEDFFAIVNAVRWEGATSDKLTSIASLGAAAPGDLSFLGNPKYKVEVAKTRASYVLLPLDYVGQPRANQVFVFVENPSVALARVCARIEQSLWPKPAAGVHTTAVIAPGAIVPAPGWANGFTCRPRYLSGAERWWEMIAG